MSPYYHQSESTWTDFAYAASNTATAFNELQTTIRYWSTPTVRHYSHPALSPKAYARLHLSIARSGPRVKPYQTRAPGYVSVSSCSLRAHRSRRTLRTGFNHNVKRV